MDLFSRKIVGWAMAERADLPSAALRMAISAQRPGAGLIHHSDRGVQYASAEYRKLLQSAGFKASMSRKADMSWIGSAVNMPAGPDHGKPT